MNARELQTTIKKDLEALFSGTDLKAPPPPTDNRPAYQLDGPEQDPPEETPGTAKISVFEQELPIRDASATDDPYPYIIAKLDTGGIDTPTDPHKVNVILLIGIYDNDRQNQGHKTVLEIIERIQTHYEKSPTLGGGVFQFTDPFKWVLQDEPSWPYFYGACNLSFNLYAQRTEGSIYT